MRKIIIAFIFFILVTNLIHAGTKDYPPDIEKIIKRGELIIGMYQYNAAPFVSKNAKGEFIGLDIDIARNIAKELGVKLKIKKSATFNNLTNLLAKNEVDMVISNYSFSLERAKRILYSTPYVTLEQALLINRLFLGKYHIEADPLPFLKKSKSLRIGTIKETAYVEFAKKLFPYAILKEYNFVTDALNDLIKNKIDAFFYDNNEIMKIFYQNPNLAISFQPFMLKEFKDYIGIGVNWQKIYLLQYINVFLKINDINYSISDLIKKYPEIYSKK